MSFLPPLVHGSACWHLPLTDHAAAQVLAAVLTDDRESRQSQWNQLLRVEPTLALWAICRSKRWDRQPPGELGAIAAWFADFGLDVLQWSGDGRGLPQLEHLLDRWAQMAQEAVAAAVCAERQPDRRGCGMMYLYGLLHAAGDWLATCGPAAPLDGPLPTWLTGASLSLSETREPCETRRPLASPPAALGSTDLAEWVAALEAAEPVRQRWCSPGEGLGCLLPELMSRLQRLHRLETEFHGLVEREKLEALKQLAYGASHEINNPLANISTRAQTLMREEADPDRRHKLSVINAQAFRAHEMIADMMLFARPPALQREPVELTALVDRVLHELAEQAAAQGSRLERVDSDLLVISADPEHLSVAFRALCTNSLEALRAGGRVWLSIQAVDQPGESGEDSVWAQIAVCDDGPGIAPEVRRHLFDPYFSGREAGRGLGLGLSKCWRIVTEHGGRIQVESSPGGGAAFTILLPAEPCQNTLTAC